MVSPVNSNFKPSAALPGQSPQSASAEPSLPKAAPLNNDTSQDRVTLTSKAKREPVQFGSEPAEKKEGFLSSIGKPFSSLGKAFKYGALTALAGAIQIMPLSLFTHGITLLTGALTLMAIPIAAIVGAVKGWK